MISSTSVVQVRNHHKILRPHNYPSTPLRTEPVEGYITYVVENIKLYKAEPDTYYIPTTSFVVKDYENECTLTLELGEQYLIGLVAARSGQLAAPPCLLTRPWGDVTEEVKVTLETGCEDDPCYGSCGEFQVRDYRVGKGRKMLR